MAGTAAAAPMDIDAAAPPGAAAKGKAPLSATGRAAPWVEKYRPQSLADVAAHMTNKDVERVPVVRGGRLVGVLTRGDIVRKLIAP